MAKNPLYYGGSSASAVAYGGKRPGYYGKSPAYYGKGPSYYGKGPAYYGRGPGYYGLRQYGAYGSPAYGGGNGGADDGSIVGTITIGRMLRVVSQRWLSVFVFLLVGLVVAFAVYRISPTIYSASSEFTMDMRRYSGGGRNGNALTDTTLDLGSTYEEVFNTRISDWRSDKIVTKIVQQYRANHPASTIADSEIIDAFKDSELELQRHSRIITITVKSTSAALAAAIANAYAEAIEAFTDEENKVRCDKAVAQIHANVEKKRRETDKVAKQLLDFRTANKVDSMKATQESLQQAYTTTSADILRLEADVAQLIEWEKMLTEVQKDPKSYGNLSDKVPRAEEIATEFRAYQDADSAYQSLLVTFTENHPDVITKKMELDMARQRFLDAAARALATGRAMLQVNRNQLTSLRTKAEDLKVELASVSQRIVLAESGLTQLEAEYVIANDVLKGLILDENQARLEAEHNNEIVRVGRQAEVPQVPVFPNPVIIFGAGVFLSIAFGLLFVLVLDNLEDTVVNLSDIEGRLALKVLAVLPHVRRKKREQVAKFIVEDKYSQFSEAMAGLRNLLDSPRYEALSHCMLIISTQPGEGKTITANSLAISYAQTGKKTLLVDFDLRRPRGARVWGIELTKEKSFSHVLQNANDTGTVPDFSTLVSNVSVDNLDMISSLPPDDVNPATILGSGVINHFFDWARTNYDRIIIDSPPYGLVGDVVSLAVLADSSIVMCCPDRTHFKPIQYCSRCLTEAGANILGVIVNDVEVSNASAFSPSARHHHYRSGYNNGYGGYGYGSGYGYGYGGYRPKKEKAKKIGEAAKAADEGAEFTDEE